MHSAPLKIKYTASVNCTFFCDILHADTLFSSLYVTIISFQTYFCYRMMKFFIIKQYFYRKKERWSKLKYISLLNRLCLKYAISTTPYKLCLYNPSHYSLLSPILPHILILCINRGQFLTKDIGIIRSNYIWPIIYQKLLLFLRIKIIRHLTTITSRGSNKMACS